MYRVSTVRLCEALKEQGFDLVPNCGDVTLELPVDGVVTLVQREMLSGERLAQVSRALLKMSGEDK